LHGAASGKKIGVLTSGGDAQGMNSAVRAIVRTALFEGAEPYLIREGYHGLVEDDIAAARWEDASGILSRGGTAIGTFRSDVFPTPDGMRRAAANLVKRGIDRLIVIGGDGSLTGLSVFASKWASLLDELVDAGTITAAQRDACPALIYGGLAGSIDNDLVGLDVTIGVDSALHRIQDAIDAIASTAASHHRCFVVEVMGRRCGYLAVAAAISGGCDYVLLPELPPAPGWEADMCAQLRASVTAGRKDSIVILAEGAVTAAGDDITAEHVRQVIEDGIGADTRVTILGHVQRGGTPSAFDRWAPAWLGFQATAHVLAAGPGEGVVFGVHGEQVRRIPLDKAVEATRSVPGLIRSGRSGEAVALRGEEFQDLVRIFGELSRPAQGEMSQCAPEAGAASTGARRIGVMHVGALAPGMNTAAKSAVRLGISRGFDMIGIEDGFVGLMAGRASQLTWSDVDGWTQEGGAVLGTQRHVPGVEELYAVARSVEALRLDALMLIGGWAAYAGAHLLDVERSRYPVLQMPMICLPATIDNNLPGTYMSIGADTALNVVVDCIDKLRMSASASRRCFIVETMGRDCGYLALLGGLAGGAEQVYLNETGITLSGLRADIDWLRTSFDQRGRSLFLAVRNENANHNYTTDVLAHLFDQEGEGRYSTRTFTVGHIQQGGSPTPADRLLATRLSDAAVAALVCQLDRGDKAIRCIGLQRNRIVLTGIADAMAGTDDVRQRPVGQWWLGLKQLVDCINRESY